MKRKGISFERSVVKKLRRQGYYAMRAAGSFGVFDVLAVNKEEVLGVQCKINGKLTKAERKQLILTGKEYGITPCIAYRRKKGKRYHIIIEKLTEMII